MPMRSASLSTTRAPPTRPGLRKPHPSTPSMLPLWLPFFPVLHLSREHRGFPYSEGDRQAQIPVTGHSSRLRPLPSASASRKKRLPSVRPSSRNASASRPRPLPLARPSRRGAELRPKLNARQLMKSASAARKSRRRLALQRSKPGRGLLDARAQLRDSWAAWDQQERLLLPRRRQHQQEDCLAG